jgi:hypothetical protein
VIMCIDDEDIEVDSFFFDSWVLARIQKSN